MTEANQLAAVAGTRRPGWVVTYRVEVTFDTDLTGRRYDHVGTLARCQCCQEELHIRHSDNILERHARTHQGQLSIDRDAPAHPLSSPQEVITRHNHPRQ